MTGFGAPEVGLLPGRCRDHRGDRAAREAGCPRRRGPGVGVGRDERASSGGSWVAREGTPRRAPRTRGRSPYHHVSAGGSRWSGLDGVTTAGAGTRPSHSRRSDVALRGCPGRVTCADGSRFVNTELFVRPGRGCSSRAERQGVRAGSARSPCRTPSASGEPRGRADRSAVWVRASGQSCLHSTVPLGVRSIEQFERV